MKLNLLLFFLLTFTIVIEAQGQTAFDTVETTNVGAGMIYRRIIAPAVPWSINTLEINLNDSSNFFETVKAQDKIIGFETVRSMAERNSYNGHTVVGAVNGDFYNTGTGASTNMQISNGEITQGTNNRPVIGFDINNSPFIDNVIYSGSVIDNDSAFIISNVNASRGTDELIFYNHFYGNSTGTNSFGTEILIRPLENWLVNDTILCVVVNKENGVGDMAITDTTAVLSGNGISNTYLDSIVNIGDTLKIVNKISVSLSKIKELIGGNPKLVVDGQNKGDNVSREPRTAIGFSKDTTKLFVFAVDGRRVGFSDGMTLSELADYMINSGVYTGLNLDGGASTTMVVRDSVMNMPSGGNERAVSNSLLFLSKAGTDTLNLVQISPDYFKLYFGETVQFKLQGFDKYYNPIPINKANINYSLSHNFGSISAAGFFTAGNIIDTGYVIADYDGMKDSAMILTKGISVINISPRDIVTDTIRYQEFKMKTFDSEGIERNLALNKFNWSLSDSTIGSIDSMGIFKGIAEGETKVIVAYNELKDTASVNVVIKHGNQLIDSLENLSNWVFTNENLDSNGTDISISNSEFTQGNGSFKIDYQFTYDSNKLNYIYLDTNYPLAGVPDSIILDAKSDGQKHLISYIVENGNQQQFNIPVKKYFEITDHFDSMGGALQNAAPIVSNSIFSFPVTLKQIVIKLASSKQAGQVYSGTLFLDNLRVSYPDSIMTSVADENQLPSSFSLAQNYPNPFNPTTRIIFNIEKDETVSLKVFDILGREVATLINGKINSGKHELIWNASNLPSGVYIYRLQSDGKNLAKKMILLK